MQPVVTWYDVLDVMPGASTEEIQGKYDARASLLRPEFIAGAPSAVLTAVSRAQQLLDSAWRVLGDPATRARYDAATGIRRSSSGAVPAARPLNRMIWPGGSHGSAESAGPAGRLSPPGAVPPPASW